MRKKRWRVIGIVLGVLLIFYILIGPAAPLWIQLGLKPVCVQGEWPHLKIVSCPPQQAAITPLPLPTLVGQQPIPIIVDDDGSPDGMIALLFFLSNPRFDVKAVTISQGEAHPGIFAQHVMQLLASLDRAEIPVGAGRESPLEGNNAFPDDWRQASDNFWSLALSESEGKSEPNQAAKLIANTITGSLQPVVIFVSGTHTNLAEALRIDPDIAENIQGVYVMGGSIYVPGNIHSDAPAYTNKVAEWNIWVDPVAADDVFSAELPLHLVPLDATRQVTWSQEDVNRWKSSSSPESTIAGDLLQMMLNAWSVKETYVWDLVAATQATNPSLCEEVSLAVDVVTGPGEEQGRTVVRQDSPNMGVCLEPNTDQMKALVDFEFIGK
jgi:inosine-uridine nucleoside N-ribohydrolase